MKEVRKNKRSKRMKSKNRARLEHAPRPHRNPQNERRSKTPRGFPHYLAARLRRNQEETGS